MFRTIIDARADRVATFRLLSVAVAAVLIGTGPGLAKSDDRPNDDRPNIVLILVDDMGYGDPGCFNPESKIPTPNIDSLATSGMRFTDAHAPGPLCHMSRYGLMTGMYPFRINVNRWPTQPLIEPGQMTVASLLDSQGYETAMVGKWHVGFKENGYDHPLPGGPVDVGFDSFFGIRASTDIPPYFYIRDNHAVAPPSETIAANRSPGWSPIQGAFWREGGIAPGLELEDVLPRFTEEAITVIDKHRQSQIGPNADPLMLYLAFPAPHTPWLPSPAFQNKSGAGMYGDFLVMVDAMIGRVLDKLEEAGMSDNTMVIFTSDNGPVWYDEDVKRLGHDSSGGLRGMKADAWECGHRMPMIVRWPGKVKPGSVSNQLVSFVDFLATFADVTGQQLEEGDGPDSMSFLPALLGKASVETKMRDTLVLKSGSGLMMVRQGDWKLIDGLGSGGFSKPSKVKAGEGDPTGQLYDLKNDLGETTNLFRDKPEVIDRLKRELDRVVSSHP
ncbi:sulfatase family protein [Novipirellula artificiosorum]|uniref:Arylsulfatase n=1 Tax=Novipirellula artificiosorum TaxID=2528016 RepID=A0A5C6DAN8_9BACT|nr:arylsulfatase [Novipirellula artificiosorum]TWU34233.1 Arylsulfatase [Novipirellula artificiosorum]